MPRACILGILSIAGLVLGCGNDPISGDESTIAGDEIETQRAALTIADVQPFAAPVAWTGSGFTGTRGTFFADVTGGGTADAIAVNDTSILVRRSNGAPPLLTSETWLSGVAFFGSVGTFFADVTGGGTADAIAVNAGAIVVRPSTGSAFGGSSTWLSSGFSGTVGTFFADVNADGRADAIAVNGSNVLVRLSTGSAFTASQSWLASGFSGAVGTFVADVTGDGRADLIAVNSGNILVRRSTGTAFGSSETWASVGFSGSRATLVRDVTGDGLADVVAVNANDIRMRRSGRWFFGTVETMSAVATSSTARKRLADLTGDGRADYVEVPSGSSIQVRKRQDREIPLRIVQFVNDCGQARTDAEIQAALADANSVFRDAGLKFTAVPVSSNPDCPGNSSSHVVISTVLSAVTSSTPASAEDLAKAKEPFNSSCNIGYSDISDLGLNQQIWWVAARCSKPGEALVYVADVGTNAANNAGDGNLILYDRNDGFNLANGHFAHELGHYLGLDHTFAGGYNIIGYMDPETGQGQRLAARWDLVASGTQFFNSKAEATALETSLVGLEVGGTGWFCPSGDPLNKPCPFGTLPGGHPPPATLGMPIAGSATQRVYTYLPETTAFDVRMKGLAPRMLNNLPGINTMSYSYAPSDPPNLKRGVSLSQIEVIQSNLNKELLTKYLDANGRVVFGNRTLLGISGPAPAVTFMPVGSVAARNAVGSIASNSFNTWIVSTSAFNSDGFKVYEYDGRLRQWNARSAGAYQLALPSGGANQPWAITGGVPGPVKRWNGSTFANLPGDPQAQACARSLAVGNHVSGGYAWSIGCFGPNFDGNFKIQRYSDPTGWQDTAGPGEGWGIQVAVDWEGVPWARTILSGGAITLFKAVMDDVSGAITSWLQVPPPSGVTPAYLTGSAASAGTRLPVNFIGTDGRIYVLKKSTLTWTDAGPAPFSVAAAGGGMPYLWLVDAATGAISYAR